MVRNAVTYAQARDDTDLEKSAALFEEKAEVVYQQGVRKIESYGNSSIRGHSGQ